MHVSMLLQHKSSHFPVIAFGTSTQGDWNVCKAEVLQQQAAEEYDDLMQQAAHKHNQ